MKGTALGAVHFSVKGPGARPPRVDHRRRSDWIALWRRSRTGSDLMTTQTAFDVQGASMTPAAPKKARTLQTIYVYGAGAPVALGQRPSPSRCCA